MKMNFIHNFCNLGKLWKRAISKEYFSMKIVLCILRLKKHKNKTKNLIKCNNLIKEAGNKRSKNNEKVYINYII